MDSLPPTVVDADLLALLCRALKAEPTQQLRHELRFEFFRSNFSWQMLVDLAAAHELLIPLIFTLKRNCLLPPLPSALGGEARATHVTSRLEEAYRGHLERQDDLKAQLKTAVGALNHERINPVLLKGAVNLTMPPSEWHEARTMRDLDILVHPGEAQKANQTLVSLGYRSDEDPPPLDRHLPELRLPGHAGTIEIHTEALSFNARFALSTAELRTHAIERTSDGVTFQVPAPEWHLLHGLLHHQLSDRGHARRMLALKGLWEFARAGAEIPSTGWSTIIAHAEGRGILPMLSSWCVQANQLFGLAAPQELLTSKAGRKHADLTFRRARMAHGLRQTLFVADKLRFALAPATLALRYSQGGNPGSAALRHLGFLWRHRVPLARRWLGN